MATRTVCKIVLFLFPFAFILFTYYLIISAKKDAEKSLSIKFNSLAHQRFPNCPSNHYILDGSCLKCPDKEFSLEGWISCMSWLNCDDIAHDVRIRHRIGNPGPLNAVKKIYKADWFGYDVVYSRCSHIMYAEDCLHGLKMVEGLQGSKHIIQLIGICYDNLEMVTAYHPYGSADNLEELFDHPKLSKYNTLSTRFQLSFDYVSILHFLHNSPLGTRVMCDANDIQKTLSQYLISKDFHLILNDVDALPEVKKERNLIKCGRRQITGSFVAPEQLWPFIGKEFDDDYMPGYDEKIDIWKIPSITDKLLGRVKNSNNVRRLLLHVHDNCRRENPRSRPTAVDIMKEYSKVAVIVKSETREEI